MPHWSVKGTTQFEHVVRARDEEEARAIARLIEQGGTRSSARQVGVASAREIEIEKASTWPCRLLLPVPDNDGGWECVAQDASAEALMEFADRHFPGRTFRIVDLP